MSKKDVDELRWVRVFSPVHIPKYLVEQVKGRDYEVDKFYKFQEINCLIDEGNGPTLNPMNHLYVLVDEENVVKGYLWFVIDVLTEDIIINTFSVDKEYWHGGKAMKRVITYVKEILKKLKLKKVYWMTNYPKHSERYGFKRSRQYLMEYDPKVEEKNGKDINGKHSAQEKHQYVDAGATKDAG